MDNANEYTYVKSPDGYTLIGTGKSTDTDIFIPDEKDGIPVKRIAPSALYRRRSTTSVRLPRELRTIGAHAFEGCSLIKSIEIPEKTEYIGFEAFVDCESLTEVSCEDLISWCSIAFEDENANPLRNGAALIIGGLPLRELVLPEELEYTGYASFTGCTSLESVTVPSTVKAVSTYSFDDCVNLKSVCIREGVCEIRPYAFRGCVSLERISLPSSLEKIGECAFYDCSSLRSVTIPEGIKKIPDFAFRGCTSLEEITLGRNITSIGFLAFEDCHRLSRINFDGTADEWEAVEKFEDMSKGVPSCTVHCKDKELPL